jgi:pimeloyl-ACP methyl ester carboxylesterase
MDSTTARNQTMTLRDGRNLGYAQYGDPAGVPVFYFHAAASSRLEQPASEKMLLERGIRLITSDRPGHGLSDFQPGRRLLDWPDDVAQLADYLNVAEFYVAGYSAGGPHALACAYKLPGRVIAGATVGSLAPAGRRGAFRGMPLPNQILNGSARWAPWLTKLIRRMTRRMIMNDVKKASQRLMSSLPEVDKEVLYEAENIKSLASSLREGFRGGWQGVARDDMVINQDWGFDVGDIEVRIDIWQGELDVNVPSHAGAYLHEHIPNSHATLFPDEGHFLLPRHAGEVLAALVSESDREMEAR